MNGDHPNRRNLIAEAAFRIIAVVTLAVLATVVWKQSLHKTT